MAKRIFQNQWWVVFASVLSLTVGSGAIMVFATGVLLKPLGQELHFGRGVFSSAISLGNIIMGCTCLLLGRWIDRYGVRVVMLPFIALFALSTAGLSLITASVTMLMLMFAIQGIFASVQTPTGYSKMITARFDDQRGLALGVALTGVGLGTILVPQYARILLQHFGWRTGYLGLGVAVIVLAFIPVAFFFGEPEDMRRARLQDRQKNSSDKAALPGIILSEALRRPNWWALAIGIFLMEAVSNGVVVHLVPMLTDRGISITKAVAAMSIAGLALIVGRLISGYLLDKIFAIYVAIFFFVLQMIGVAILISGAAGAGPMLATIIMGLTIGAEFDLMAFIVSRYFGVRAFGALYGFIIMVVNFANAAGTGLMGWCFQLKHSYLPMLYAFEGFLVVTIVLFARMGPYRYPAPRRQPLKRPEAATASR
jgi:MFS family permease